MSDGPLKIGGNLPPVHVTDTNLDADESFLDDLIGAETKRREAADKRAATETPNRTSDADRARQQRRVSEASKFQRSGQENDVVRREKRFRQKRDKPEGLSKSQGKEVRQQGVETLANNEEAVSELMHEIYTLMEQIDVLGGLDAMDKAARSTLDREGLMRRGQDKADVGRLAGNIARLNTLNLKLKKAEMQVKQQLQQLLAGTTGLLLLGDPRLTFKRLLDRIKQWPRRIRPGRRPESDEEFDDFIAWVFEPPEAPASDVLEEYVW